MANATPTRLGQNLATGDANALFLKIFSGEVLSAFGRENQMMNMTTVRNIQNGKSASFPVTGKITADYHTAGNEITCLLYTSPSPRDATLSRMPSSA